MQELLDSIPFVTRSGLVVDASGEGHARIRLPFDAASVTNHVGTVHAAALVLVGETAAGGACLSSPALQGLLLLAKGLSIRYKRPASGDVIAEAHLDPATAAEVRERVLAVGKADLDVPVQLRADHGELVAELTVTFHFRQLGA